VTLVFLTGGCGGSDETAAPSKTVSVTVTVSDWAAGDRDAAGEHEGATCRFCYSSPDVRGLEESLEPRYV
jgi:hypothetical protein